MGPPQAVAEIRHAVRGCLDDLDPGALVLAACSGGADSLALAAALAFVAPRLNLRAGGVTVDHALQPGSAERAAEVAELLAGLGLAPVERVTVAVPAAWHGGHGGPEAAARAARYQALAAVAARTGAAAVLLGHTLDDQAETVLLGLARGSGGRSLAGMPARQGRYRRPLLSVRRPVTSAACAALGLRPWDDPHNADPRYARARVRHQVLPVLEAALGPGVAEALARTASMLRADAEYLDELARSAAEGIRGDGATRRASAAADAAAPVAAPLPAGAAPVRDTVLPVDLLARLPTPIRTRVLRDAAIAAGCPPGSLTAGHVGQLDELVTRWRGQRWLDLPGGVRARRGADGVRFGDDDTEDGRGRQ